MEQYKDFLFYCDKFIEHAIRYSYKEQEQIKLEKLAFKKGIISETVFNNLKNARQNALLSLNNIAYSFKSASIKLKNSDVFNEDIYKLLKNMVKACEVMNK